MLDRLEDAFSRLGRFTADIAHELRTPVNALRSEVEVTLGRPRSEEEYRSALGSFLDECDRLTRLINSLLLLARAADPRRELVTDTVDVTAELKIALEFYEAAASEKGVELRVRAEGDLRIQADRTLVQQAIGNLVSNALPHTPSGGSVTLFGSRTGDEVRFGVSDTGGGVAPEHLPRVFERFYRPPTEKPGGMGLGLAIVEAIARLHGGAVRAESEPGRGMTVTLHLPAHPE
jgi:two-component system heavy metal sensor histidine kinase CusS